jgi:hypothetical protein
MLYLWYVAGMHIYGTKNRQTSFGATDFLRANERLASLLPTAMRMGRLQADCGAVLPPVFGNCDVLSFQDGALVIAVPTSAVAAKLKQQVLKLQNALQQRGWQVDSIKLKVQVARAMPPQVEMRTLSLPPTAVDAFEQLGESLPDTPQNSPLIAALRSLAAKRRAGE